MGILHLGLKSPIDQIPGLYVTVKPIGQLISLGRDERRRAETYDLMENDNSSLTSVSSDHAIGTAEPKRRSGHINAGFEGLRVDRRQTDIAQTSNIDAQTGDFRPPVPKQGAVKKFLHDADRAGREINPIYKVASLYVSALREERLAKKQAA